MSIDVEQGKVIERLNKYLKWNNLPLKMNKAGMCNGLAMVYAKYALEKKQKEFMELLHYVAGKKINQEMEDRVNFFITEILVSYMPEMFDLKLNQSNSMQTLKVNDKPLKSAFDFALTTSDKNWEEIIKTIGLQENEVMRVSSINHTVCVGRNKGKYVIYNPNYSSGCKEFHNERELISELHTNVFHYTKGPLGLLSSGPLGMEINVIPHPDNPPRSFPKVSDIYDAYLNRDNVNDVAITDGKEFNTLQEAASIADSAAIKKLLSLGAIDKELEATADAIIANNIQAIDTLLLNIKPENEKFVPALFVAALRFGRKEALEQLINFKNPIPLNPVTAVYWAAHGGNPELLKRVLDLYDAPLNVTVTKGDAISSAIEGGSVECVEILMGYLNTKKQYLTDDKKLHYLLESIKNNQPYITAALIQNTPEPLFKAILMSTAAVERTDLSILHQLREKGVVFSDTANAVIAQKEHRPVGIMMSIGIMLTKFSDFCKEMFNTNSGLSYNRASFFEKSNANNSKLKESKNENDENRDIPKLTT